MSLNDHHYYEILCEYIDPKDRVICSRRDRHHLMDRIPGRKLLMASIYVHKGTTCDKHCICRFFSGQDMLYAYDDYKNDDEYLSIP